MLLSFEPLDEICIVSGSRIAALYYTDHVTLFCLHAQSLELTLKHWNRLLDTTSTAKEAEKIRWLLGNVFDEMHLLFAPPSGPDKI